MLFAIVWGIRYLTYEGGSFSLISVQDAKGNIQNTGTLIYAGENKALNFSGQRSSFGICDISQEIKCKKVELPFAVEGLSAGKITDGSLLMAAINREGKRKGGVIISYNIDSEKIKYIFTDEAYYKNYIINVSPSKSAIIKSLKKIDIIDSKSLQIIDSISLDKDYRLLTKPLFISDNQIFLIAQEVLDTKNYIGIWDNQTRYSYKHRKTGDIITPGSSLYSLDLAKKSMTSILSFPTNNIGFPTYIEKIDGDKYVIVSLSTEKKKKSIPSYKTYVSILENGKLKSKNIPKLNNRTAYGIVLLKNNKLLFFGGQQGLEKGLGYKFFKDGGVYDLAKEKYIPLKNSMKNERTAFSAFDNDNNKVIITGGYNNKSFAVKSAEIYQYK